MNDDNADKTRIKSSPAKPDDDKTRIAAPEKPSSAVASDDKTRIAKARTDQSSSNLVDEDKTRIAPAGSAGVKQTPDINDVTQFNPNVKIPEDKTRVAAKPQVPPDSPLNNELPASAHSQSGEHGVLKDRFVLEKVLGAGGMGIVYKARDRLKIEAQDRDPYVAIKVLSEEFKSHPEAFISLQRESRKSQRIAHPNIVNVYDFDRDGDTVFMTMEFMDGSPLDQLIRQYKSTGLPTDDAWGIIHGMASALSHAHAEKIIHSDFKPGNVFVTNKGLAKVFDFGIARAVAQVEHLDDNPDDKTVFDAGNLGALTPAYASLEMLEGEEPDIRDDIYALGCVAYELFTGSHPYNKVPADEAEKQGLKPKRINNIKKYQWKAIEKAISFRRKDRIETVDKFVEAISPKLKTTNRLATVMALLLSVAITIYFVYFQERPVDPYSEFDIRNELELKIKIDFYREDLQKLISNPTFTDPWQDDIWKDVSDLKILTKGGDEWLDLRKSEIYSLYQEQISSAIKSHQYNKASSLIENAKRYTDNLDELNASSDKIAAAIKLARERKARQAEAQQQKMLSEQSKPEPVKPAITTKAKQTSLFDVALENVTTQLQCQGRLNMRNIETAIIRLKELDLKRYNSLEGNIVKSLAACITQIGKAFPERAEEAKRHSLRIFKSNRVLAAITIKDRDPCDISLAGLGSRGKRAVCKDKIKDAGSGPELVVIPANSRISAFAIGKYEVSINELNAFCKSTKQCAQLNASNAELPASEMELTVVKAYLKWLSRQSGQKYRLPTKNEWLYAAKSRRKALDANRNCKLSTRGIQKGEELVQVNIGRQNSWGLVNYVGNVQEWVYDKGRKLVAVGGSFKESMDNCDITTTVSHNGNADKATGFRVLRELRTGS